MSPPVLPILPLLLLLLPLLGRNNFVTFRATLTLFVIPLIKKSGFALPPPVGLDKKREAKKSGFAMRYLRED